MKLSTGRRAGLFVLLLIVLLLLSGVRFDRPAQSLRAQWASAPSKFIDVDGTQVHYRDEGQGPVVVLLHGTGASLHTWDAWTQTLEANHRVVRLDLPGFGLTGPDGSHDYQMSHYTRFLDHFFAQVSIERAHVVGNSYGGQIAWAFALDHPERVQTLTLIDSAGFPKTTPTAALRLARTPVLSNLLCWITPTFLVKKTLTDIYVDDSKVTDALVERYLALQLREGNRAALVERMQTDMPDETARLTQLHMPTLILWGAQDPWIGPENAERFHRAISGSEMIVYPNAGHVPMEEIPEQTVADAQRFFDAH